ncbi:hypothetical protein [Sphingomonas sp. TZW2008]|uniref:HD domain-containing protein n=1 Tax=Sphingomonas sp. TZW2008 TaxID=1917973 RepID=UPI000A27079B|nr:hypothetical protein [Sphingomonas sp. TZW2008]
MPIAALAAELCATPAGMAIRCRYDEPWRRYHGWSHPLAMIASLAAAEADGVAIADPVAAIGFILWHDSVYDPQAAAGRNEQLSAALCAAEFPGLANERSVARACAAIVATIDHRVPDGDDSPDAALLLDIDLAILGFEADTFDCYDAGIAAEYAHVVPDAYRTGRSGVLRRFLERERLFITQWAYDRWEARARDNLARCIAALET